MEDRPIESTEAGRSFTDTFKNILSSVLKTDLGQVLKNRSEKLGKLDESGHGEGGSKSPETKNLELAVPAIRSPSSVSTAVRSPGTSSPDSRNPSVRNPETRCSPTLRSQETRSPTLRSQETRSPPLRNQETRSPESRYSPTLRSREVKSPTLRSQEVKSPTLRSQEVKSPTLRSQEVKSPTLRSQEVKSPTLRSQEVKSPTLRSQEVKSPTVSNVDTRSSTVRSPDARSLTAKSPDTSSLTAKSPTDASSPTARSPDVMNSGTKAPDTKSPDNRSPEEINAEIKMPETRSPETRASAIRSPPIACLEPKAQQTGSPETRSLETRTHQTRHIETRRTSEIKVPDTVTPESGGPQTCPPAKAEGCMTGPPSLGPAVKINKARKSMSKPVTSSYESEMLPKKPKSGLEEKNLSTHFTKTGKRKMKKFKGGTYHLSITGKPKKYKRRRTGGQDQADAGSNSTGDTICDDQTSPEDLASESEVGSEPSSGKTGPSSRATISPSASEISEFHLEMSASSRASVSMVGDDDSGLDANDEPDLEGESSNHLLEEKRLEPKEDKTDPSTPDNKVKAFGTSDSRRLGLEKTEDEEASVALSVKRRRILQQRKGDGDDAESVASSWSTGSDQPTPKRARKGGVPISSLMGSKQELPKRWFHKCTCREESEPPGECLKEMFCQAVDCIDERLIGCCNVVTKPLLNRPARKIPFVWMCDMHRFRLRAHQCCPGCGLFCSQGLFMQCQPDACAPVHLFHERCCGIHEGEARCPHCGSVAQWKPVRLRISSARAPTFFVKQQPLPRQPSARMTISRGQDALMDGWDLVPAKSCKLPDAGREISSAGLPVGPDRAQLESLLMNLSLERPMNLRYTIKSLYNAAKSGDIEKILQMLAMGFDPNHRFEEHENEAALHAACASGHLVAVHVLQQAGAYLDCLDNHLRTPLMAAIDNRQTTLVQYLVRAGVHLEARGEDGMTVLHVAAKSGNMEACRLLLDTGKINVNIQDDGGWTPLVWGAEFRHKDIVRFLLRSGSDPNVRDNEQNVALHWASFSGCLEICELLLNAGCDLGSINEHGDTPLHIAARQDNYECIILFLARNADISALNKEDETPIMCCPDKSSQTWMALSMNSQLKQFAQLRATRSELILHRDVSYGKEANPIQCINGVDDESFPVDYLYVIENCETSPIHLNRSIISLQSCSCSDDCATSTCTCASLSLKCWFTSDGGLIPEFNLLDPPMIFECNRACRCWQNCNNRVVQHGITCRLQLFRTKGKGWGVRALRDIPRGTFICEYIGEVISDSEADQREDDSYLFDLDNRDGETYCIDARHYGNISRFVNHLCEPNLVPVKVFVDHHDLRFPRIAFFSSRDIKAYEELGFDYGEKFWIIKYKTFTCMCASDRCKYSADKIQEMLESYSRRQREEVES